VSAAQGKKPEPIAGTPTETQPSGPVLPNEPPPTTRKGPQPRGAIPFHRPPAKTPSGTPPDPTDKPDEHFGFLDDDEEPGGES